jgi:hypothetical protein
MRKALVVIMLVSITVLGVVGVGSAQINGGATIDSIRTHR